MRYWSLASRVALAALLFPFSGCEDFDFETYEAVLEGSQEVPPNSSGGTGRGVLVLSRNADRADVTVTVDGLTNVTASHIHRAPRGVNGGVIFFLYRGPATEGPFGTGQSILKTWTPTTTDAACGSCQPFTAQNLADLRAGNLYVNVHTTTRPAGEIRGQLVRK